VRKFGFSSALVATTAAFMLVGLAGGGLASAEAAPSFSCDASALRVTLLTSLKVEPVTANHGNPSCADASDGIPTLDVPNAMSPIVSASALTARTEVLCASDDPNPDAPPIPGNDETDNDHCDASPPITQQVVSKGGVADITINLGGLVIRARAVESKGRAYCDPATNQPAFSSESRVVDLTINGTPITLPPNNTPEVLDIGLVRLALNERIGTEGVQTDPSASLTRRALHVSIPSDGSIADVAVGESKVDYTDDVCPEGRVVIKKETSPDQPTNTTDFGFTTTGGLTPAAFSLKDDGTQTFDNVRGKFTVTEDAQSFPWSLETLECTDATGNTTTDVPSRTATIDVAGGETVTCTFTNKKAPLGTVVIRKQTNPDESPKTTDFNFTSTGGLTPGTFTLKDDGTQTFSELKPGVFTVTEGDAAGYNLDSIDCIDATGNTTTDVANHTATIDVAGDETVTCTFNNRKIPNGTVIIRKQTDPDENPNTTDFGFSATGGLTPGTFSLKDDGTQTFNNVTPGSYTVTEDAQTAPWSLDSIDCVDATTNTTTDVPNRKATIDVAPGETVICTFTNKKAQNGTIVVHKQTDPDEDPNVTDFGFTASSGLTPATFTLKDDGVQTFSNVTPGAYSITENAPAAPYTLSVIDCSDPSSNTTTSLPDRKASIDLAAGETVSCTFVNFKPGPGTVTCPTGTTPDASGHCVTNNTDCPAGSVKDPSGKCVVSTTGCPAGSAQNAQGQCISTNVQCPEGTTLLPGSLTCESAPQGGRIGVLGNLQSSPCKDRKSGADFAILGTNGADKITGTNLSDRIFPFGGGDRVSGGRGNDCIEGGSGGDVLDGSNGNDYLLGQSGNDSINGSTGNDRLDGGSGSDRIRGGQGNDRLIGGSGNDRLRGEDGNDVMISGSGNDSIHTGNGRDVVNSGSGNDIINAATVGAPVRVDCGPGKRDRVRINTNEIHRTKNCEFIYILRRVDKKK
jgi:Ca2+-binding RTX toxin-like protein